MNHLLDLLVRDDHHLALIAPTQFSITYQQLRQNLIELVSQLNQFGLQCEDRIAIAMPNGVPKVLTFLASALCGIAAPLNPKINRGQME